jgi:myo-inositol 2-dehydrogenase/D-chiro-inositol 1-dehydrogenase
MLRLALIGCSDDPERYPRIAPRLRGGRFTVVMDADAVAARAAAAALGAEDATDNFDELLSKHAGEFDAAVIRTSERFRQPLSQRVAAAGKHVLVKSPMAASAAVAQEVIAACTKAGVRLMVGQAARFLPSIQAVKSSLDSGKLGEPGLLRIHRWEPPAPRTRGADATPLGCVHAVVREIDLACWLFGRAPAEIYATGQRQDEAAGYLQLHLGFGNGGMALLDHAQTLPPGDGYFSLSLIGSTGAAYVDDHHDMQLLFGPGHPAALATTQGDLHVLGQLQEFVSAVEQGREPAIAGRDGLRALQVAEAAELSMRRHQCLVARGDEYTLWTDP